MNRPRNGNGNGRGNGRGGRARGPTRANTARPTAANRLVQQGRSDLHEAGLELFGFFETMMDPEDKPPERVPDVHSAMSAVFKTPLIVNLPYSGVWDSSTASSSVPDPVNPTDGYSEVILCPGTTDCYFITHGTDVLIWDADVVPQQIRLEPILTSHPVSTDANTSGVGQGISLAQGLRVRSPTGFDRPDVALLPKLDDSGNFFFECRFESVASPSEPFSFQTNWIAEPGAPSRTSDAECIAVWSDDSISTETIQVASYVAGGNTFLFTPPADGVFVRALAFRIHDEEPNSHWTFSINPNATGIMTFLGSSACTFSVLSAPEMDELSETESERTTVLTGLLTYVGSSLQDGGQLSAARLGMGLSPLRSPRGDVYSYLASLPFYNEDYALRDGIYAWWLPDSIQEHFYVPYQQPRSTSLETTSILQYAILRDNPNQAVRLQVIQNLEILTRSRLYTSLSGPNNPAYSTVISAIKALPAVTVNSQHKGILANAMSRLKSWVMRPANWRNLLTKGAAMVHRLAPGTAWGAAAGALHKVLG